MDSLWVQTIIGTLKTFAAIYDIFTFPLYAILQKPWKRRALSRRVKVSFIRIF